MFKRNGKAVASQQPAAPVVPGRIDFEKLPRWVQDVVTSGAYGTHAQWTFLKDFMNADPGGRLAAIRAMKKMSQQDVAIKAGVRQADVSNAEQKFSEVKFGILEKILKVLNANMAMVLSPEQLGIVSPEVEHR